VSTRRNGTIYELKIVLYGVLERVHRSPALDFFGNPIINSTEIWKFKSPKLSANDDFDQTKAQLNDIRISDNWGSHVQHLGTARKVTELELEDNELLLVMKPSGAW